MPSNEPDVDVEPRLDPYHFYERDWTGYDELVDAFEHRVPEEFNVAEYVCDRWAEATPDRVAVTIVGLDGGVAEYTYGRLRRDANRLANYLEGRGVRAGDRIAVDGTQSVEALLAHLAAWKLGAVSVPISGLYGPDGLAHRLDDCGATATVVHDATLGALRDARDGLDALEVTLAAGDEPPDPAEVGFWTALDDRATEFETVRTAADDDATIVYTSGTTGPPKGVVHAHRFLLGLLPGFVTGVCNMEVRGDDSLHTPVEWSWIGTLFSGVLGSLYYGIRVVGDADPRFDPERTLSIVDEHDVTIVGGPATAYRMLMEVPDAADRFDLASLRTVVQGGESLGQGVVDWWRETVDGVAVHEGYGQTETGTFVRDCEALGVGHEPDHMGKPIPGSEVAVLDLDADEPVGPDELGEIALRHSTHPSYFVEYWNRPGATAEKRSGDWHRMGDLGSRARDGYLAFHSRRDDVIVSSGYRIGPDEIEEALAGHHAVVNAGVVGVPDETRGEIPKAFVVLAEGEEPTDGLRDELQAHVKARLARYEYPRAIEFVEALPKTTTGKVRRKDLREREDVVGTG